MTAPESLELQPGASRIEYDEATRTVTVAHWPRMALEPIRLSFPDLQFVHAAAQVTQAVALLELQAQAKAALVRPRLAVSGRDS